MTVFPPAAGVLKPAGGTAVIVDVPVLAEDAVNVAVLVALPAAWKTTGAGVTLPRDPDAETVTLTEGIPAANDWVSTKLNEESRRPKVTVNGELLP
jgi:hypothetical protein